MTPLQQSSTALAEYVSAHFDALPANMRGDIAQLCAEVQCDAAIEILQPVRAIAANLGAAPNVIPFPVIPRTNHEARS